MFTKINNLEKRPAEIAPPGPKRFLDKLGMTKGPRPSKDGEIVPGRHTSPAYSPVFIDAVKAATGERYVKPEVTR